MSTQKTSSGPAAPGRPYGFMLSRRWIGFALFVIILAGVCGRLGLWQLHRLEHRLDRNKVIEKHLKADPVPLDAALPRTATVDEDSEWTRVTVKGRFDPSKVVTVKFATRDGAPGVDVVTPLVLADGTAMLVDRGWMETENNVKKPTDLPAVPSGDVTVTGWLRPDNGAGSDAVKVFDGQVRAISSKAQEEYVGMPLRHGYLDLLKQEPSATGDLAAEPEPERGQGPHFFYALQWWFFALLAVVGYFYFARVEEKERKQGKPRTARPAKDLEPAGS